MQAAAGGGSGGEMDEIKRMLVEVRIHLSGPAQIVATEADGLDTMKF